MGLFRDAAKMAAIQIYIMHTACTLFGLSLYTLKAAMIKSITITAEITLIGGCLQEMASCV